MVQIAGKYTFVSQDNFEEYLEAAGNRTYKSSYDSKHVYDIDINS